MLEADLAGFCAQNDLVRVRDGMVSVSKRPEFKGRTVRDLTQAAYSALLSRFVGAENLPVPAAEGEEQVGQRMAEMARAEAKAQRRAGVA